MPPKAVFAGEYNDIGKLPADRLPHIAFAGRSNVGKSTLLNRLVGQKKLARTSKVPGRTQSINLYLIDNSYYFVDLPGYGYAKASESSRIRWGKLVDIYLRHVDNLLGLLFLLDCRRTPDELDLMMLEWMQYNKKKFALVLTKVDKLSNSALAKKKKEIASILGVAPFCFSDVSGIGKTDLLVWIKTIIDRQRSVEEVKN
jgi:GTP-binding protein